MRKRESCGSNLHKNRLYLTGFFGSKAKRKEAYIKKKDAKELELLKQEKQRLREVLPSIDH
jgi:hypothetical protein